ncbi:MAG: AarF/UbiB family protein [Pseudomonadota bacterium]
MSVFGDLFRLARIAATFRRTGALDKILSETGAPGRLRLGLWLITAPLWPFGAKGEASLPAVSRAVSALGAAYVKFGQILSTRPDLVGVPLSQDLRFLQDRLPPFSNDEARRIVEQQLGKPIETLFRRFDPPIAAASIAQVHPAETPEGRKLAVKVLRPDVERIFARDISAFYFVARIAEFALPKSRRLRPRDVVAHFEGVVSREMDLRMEAAAASEYADLIAGEAGFRTPKVEWSLTAKRVLSADWVEGEGLGDLDALRARGVDLPELSQRIMRLFLRTGLRDGYFHADMHQGNLKLGPDGAVVIFDFGIMGRIDPLTRRTYAEILYSYLTRDYRRGAQAHFDAGYVPRSQDIDHFAQALRSIGEPIVGQQASEISMAKVLQQLFEVTEQFGMETRPELILLQRTMVVVEGVARSLDPNFNMWETARPEVEGWMKENLGPRAAVRDLQESARILARLGPRLPEAAERLVSAAQDWALGEDRAAPRQAGTATPYTGPATRRAAASARAAAESAAPPRRGRFRAGAAAGFLLGAGALWLAASLSEDAPEAATAPAPPANAAPADAARADR